MKSTFEQWLKFQTGLRDSSRTTYRTMAQHFLDWCERRKVLMVDLAPSHLADYMNDAQADNSNGVITGRVNMLRTFFDWSAANGHMSSNPYQRALLPRLRAAKPQKVPFTYGEYQAILAEFTRAEAGYADWWPTAIRVAWHTGLRMGDVAHLRWEQTDFDRRLITVYPRKKKGSGERLEIPMEPDLAEYLCEQWLGKPDAVWVLPGMHWQFEEDRSRLSSWFRTACDRAHLPEHSFHSMRHGFVTRLLNAGVDPVTIGSLTGQTVAQIAEYAHISPLAKSEALAASRRAMESANPQPQFKIA